MERKASLILSAPFSIFGILQKERDESQDFEENGVAKDICHNLSREYPASMTIRVASCRHDSA